MSSVMTDKSRAHEVMLEALREIKASESTMEAAHKVIAREEAQATTTKQ